MVEMISKSLPRKWLFRYFSVGICDDNDDIDMKYLENAASESSDPLAWCAWISNIETSETRTSNLVVEKALSVANFDSTVGDKKSAIREPPSIFCSRNVGQDFDSLKFPEPVTSDEREKRVHSFYSAAVLLAKFRSVEISGKTPNTADMPSSSTAGKGDLAAEETAALGLWDWICHSDTGFWKRVFTVTCQVRSQYLCARREMAKALRQRGVEIDHL